MNPAGVDDADLVTIIRSPFLAADRALPAAARNVERAGSYAARIV